MKAALQEDEAYVVLDPDDAVEVSGEEPMLTEAERRDLQLALLADDALEARKPRRKAEDQHTRKVRAPRFSNAEWKRLEAQLFKVYSPTLNGVGRRKTMNAHEFVREASMHLVKLLEETPKGDKPYDLACLVPLTPPSSGTRTTEKAARATPVWPGAPLTTADLGLKLDWEQDQLPKPSGEPPPELLQAQLKEHRSRDMQWCPVEKATLSLKDDRRRPPRYDSECCICQWPHALPVDWPVDDAGAELDEKQRAKLKAHRRHVRRMLKESSPASADAKALSPLRSIWDRKVRGVEPSEEELRGELERLGWKLLGQQEWHDGWKGWVASNAAGRKVRGSTPEDLARCAAKVNRDEAAGTPLDPLHHKRPVMEVTLKPPKNPAKKKAAGPAPRLTLKAAKKAGPPGAREFHALDEAFKDVDPEALCREYYGPEKPSRPGEVYRYFCDMEGTTRPCEGCDEATAPRAWVSPERKNYRSKSAKVENGASSFGISVCRKCCSVEGIRAAEHRRFTKYRTERAEKSGPPPGSSDEFYIPLRVWLPWDAEFHFTLDVCATAESALCPRYFTKEEDALKQSWEGEVWWCNPPYSPGNLAAFIAKCDFEARQPGHRVGVALVPSRTDRKWWHDYVESMLELQRRDPALLPFSLEVRFRKGRIAFGWPDNTEGRGRNTGEDGSAILIWRRKP